MAVSSRNPLHVAAGANDYRTVDLPFPNVGNAPVTGDAWLSFFTSYDGGATWTSNLVPGYPQDTSTQGSTCPPNTKYGTTCSPIHGLSAGADPMVRAGTNGMFYYSGLAFVRDDSASSIFLARYIDDNDLEGTTANPSATYTQGTPGRTIRYLGTSVIANGNANNFYDKPALAVDMPRPGAKTCVIPAGGNTTSQQSFLGGAIYVAFTQFVGPVSNNVSQIMFSESDDCGVTWSKPFKISGSAQTNQGAAIAIDPNNGTVFVLWRVFNFNGRDQNAIDGVALLPGTNKFTPVVSVAPIQPFDQGTSDVSFRTNAYPAITVDNNSYIYLAWSQRNGGTQTALSGGDARIEVLAGKVLYSGNNTMPTGVQITGPVTVEDYAGRGHQIMPAMAYSAGKLTIAWYDFRDDDQYSLYSPSTTSPGQYTFVLEPDGQLYGTSLPPATDLPTNQPGYYLEDPPGPYPNFQTLRHTVDVRAAQARSGLPPVFSPSIMVSQYAYGTPYIDPKTEAPEQDADAPIEQLEFDSPNLPLFQSGTVPFVGDYIDVAGPTFVPAGSEWRYNNLPTDPDYTHVVWTDNRNVVPPADGNWTHYTPVNLSGQQSVYDPTQTTPTCVAGQTGMRNQDIYTATLSQGVIMGALGNSKQLSSSIQRQFAVTVQNTTPAQATYQLTIQNQPSGGGTASFVQVASGVPALTSFQISVPALSSASVPVFISSSNRTASVTVTAQQIVTGGNGVTASTIINPDPSNPASADTNIANVELYNAVISNPNAANPNAANPNAANPNAANPNAANSAISNPAVADPNAANPNAANPNAANPNAANPNAANPNAANPNAANPNAANATIANPNAANPNAANPNAANVSLANTAVLDTNYVVTNVGNTTATYNVQLAGSQFPQNVLAQVIVSGIYTTPTASVCNLTLKANFVTLVSQTQPTVISPNSISTTPSNSPPTGPTFALPPGGQAIVTIRTYALGSSTPYDPTTVVTPVVASVAANTTGPNTLPIALAILNPSFGNDVPGVQVTQTLNAIGGTPPYHWSVTASLLPYSLNGSVLSVTPAAGTAPGTYMVTIQVSDSASPANTATKTLTVNIVPPPPSIAPQTIPGQTYNTPINPSIALSVTGGTGTYTGSGLSGAPPGISSSLSNGQVLLTGTPTQTGIFSFTISVTDSAGSTGISGPFTMNVGPKIVVGPVTGFQSNLYPATMLQATGGSGNYNWSGASGINGMLLTSDGLMTGLPMASGNDTVTVTDTTTAGSTTVPYTINGTSITIQAPSAPVTVTNIMLNNAASPLQIVASPGSTVTTSFTATLAQVTYCPGCWDQVTVGFAGQPAAYCTDYGVPGQNGKTMNLGPFTLTTPNTPGRYYLVAHKAYEFGCGTAALNEPLSATSDIVLAAIDVLPSSNILIGNITITSPVNICQPGAQSCPAPSAANNYAVIPIGQSFPLNFAYTIQQSAQDVQQVEIGLNTDPQAQQVVYNGVPSSSGMGPYTLNTSSTRPSRYYIAVQDSFQYSCPTTQSNVCATLGQPLVWWNGVPNNNFQFIIGVVDVQ